MMQQADKPLPHSPEAEPAGEAEQRLLDFVGDLIVGTVRPHSRMTRAQQKQIARWLALVVIGGK